MKTNLISPLLTTLLFGVCRASFRNVATIWEEICEFRGEPCPCEPERDTGNEPAIELIDLLIRGKEFLQNYTDVDEAIIALGITGSGKTTAVQIMSGNLSKLHAVATKGEDLVIIDEEDTIGGGPASKTLFPQLFTKYYNDTAQMNFYDFPGFKDSRGSVADLAANFFMTEVVKKVRKVKLIFLITYQAMSDRLSIDMIATSAVEFVRNIEVFANSIGMIVNKADPLKSERAIIAGSVENLNKYKDYLVNVSPGDPEEKRRKLLFTDTLIANQDDTYPKLSYVTTPDQCGSLNDSEKMQNIQRNLLQLCNNLEYIQVDDDTFGFAIDGPTRDEIRDVHTVAINDVIANVTSNATLDFISWYVDIKLRANDTALSALADMLYDDKQNLDTFLIEAEKYPQSFLPMLENFWIDIGYTLPIHFKDFLEMQVEFLEFFDNAVGSPQLRDVSRWTTQLKGFQEKLGYLRTWLNFCVELEAKLYHYNFHTDRPQPPSGTEWLTYIKEKNIIPVSKEVEDAAEKMDLPEIDILNELFTFALPSPLIWCSNSTNKFHLIQGNFIRIGEIFPTITEKCDASNTEIHIYAAHSIFLDANITLEGRGCEVALMAPFWISDANEQWQLRLSGFDAGARQPPKASDGEDGLVGQLPKNGTDGCAGHPGGPGGFVFGVVTQIRTTRSILINNNGGTGGIGQEGGDPGSPFVRNANWREEDLLYDRPDFCKYNRDGNWIECSHSGINGQNAASGGNGGVGGLGGNPGSSDVTIFHMQNSSTVELSSRPGANGTSGRGGKAGSGGRAGNGYRCSRECNPWCNTKSCHSISPSGKRPGSNGSAGADGRSESCLINPIPAEKNIDTSAAVARYKQLFSIVRNVWTGRFISFLNSM